MTDKDTASTELTVDPPKQVVVHPIMFALFPALYLFSAHSQFFEFSVAIRPVLINLSVVAIVWSAARALRKEFTGPAIFLSLLIVSFYSYGALLETFVKLNSGAGFNGVQIGNRILLIILSMTTAAAAVYLTVKRLAPKVTYALNVLATILVFSSAITIAIGALNTSARRELVPDRTPLFSGDSEFVSSNNPPDIYHLVLDGYGRADYLADEFGFDNTPFVEFLADRGFYVADDSRANYPMTMVSLSSTLNFEYLHTLLGEDLRDMYDRKLVRELVRQNRATKLLRKAGYSVVSIDSEYYEANIGNPEVRISEWWHPDMFESALLAMTPFSAVASRMGFPNFYELHRQRILYALDEIVDAVALPGPKFVYTHIFVGHPPFVFTSDGKAVEEQDAYSWDDGNKFAGNRSRSREEYVAGYRDQVSFLNAKIEATIDAILERSPTPPIVVIHGDHGPGSMLALESLEGTNVRERYSILNAYHLPGGGESDLYPAISPVNTYRVIFNRFFGTQYKLLEDQSYYTPFLRPYDFTRVPEASFRVGANEVASRVTAQARH